MMQNTSTLLSETALHNIVSMSSEALGGDPITQAQFNLLASGYKSISRNYHGEKHLKQMAFTTEEEIEKFGNDIGDRKAARKLSKLINLGLWGHDAVYTQVDGGVSPEIAKVLEKYVTVNGSVYTLRENVDAKDKSVFDIALKIFNLESGKTLLPAIKQAQVNEFLSALVTMDVMKDLGHSPASIAIVAGITEGTIPFRGKEDLDKPETGHFYKLAGRLANANRELNLGLSNVEIDQAIKAAVFAATKDVLGFAGNLASNRADRLREYTKGTWELMPESDALLRGEEIRPDQYRQKMAGNHYFPTIILADPKKEVFHEYKGYSGGVELATLRRFEQEVRADNDLYLQAKTASAALVEAIANQIGAGNSTLTDIVKGAGKYLPDISKSRREESLRLEARTALEVLKFGRGDNPAFDITTSPVGAYIFETLGEEKVKQLFASVSKNIKPDAKNYKDFLVDAIGIMGRDFDTVAGAWASVANDRGYPMRAKLISALVDEIVPNRAQYQSAEPAIEQSVAVAKA